MRNLRKLELLLLFIICAAIPAYANNPPQPDGLFSILLIFPLATLGARLAGAGPVQGTTAKKIVLVVILTLSVVLCMAGTELAIVPLIVILVYGISRGVRIMRLGRGGKRILIGAMVIVWVIFGFTDYVASLSYHPVIAMSEASAVGGLRTLATAESAFLHTADSKMTPPLVYGSLDDLRKAHLIDDSYASGQVRRGYLYGEILDPAKKQFLFYAVPAYPQNPSPRWIQVVPGGSLLRAFFRGLEPPGTGIRSFAVDETQAIHFAAQRALGTPVTRAEVQTWQTFP